nr:hypothetical protein [Tanacetum cinerariifolium]
KFSDDDKKRNPSVSETVASPVIPKPFVKFVKVSDSQSKSKIDETETPKKSPVKKRVKRELLDLRIKLIRVLNPDLLFTDPSDLQDKIGRLDEDKKKQRNKKIEDSEAEHQV